jgi:hypothetical protein
VYHSRHYKSYEEWQQTRHHVSEQHYQHRQYGRAIREVYKESSPALSLFQLAPPYTASTALLFILSRSCFACCELNLNITVFAGNMPRPFSPYPVDRKQGERLTLSFQNVTVYAHLEHSF